MGTESCPRRSSIPRPGIKSQTTLMFSQQLTTRHLQLLKQILRQLYTWSCVPLVHKSNGCALNFTVAHQVHTGRVAATQASPRTPELRSYSTFVTISFALDLSPSSIQQFTNLLKLHAITDQYGPKTPT